MSRLSSRDNAKVQAALVLMHDEGHDTDEVTRYVEMATRCGTPILKAYEDGFAKFTAKVPGMAASFTRIGQLIDASDNRTVTAYIHALGQYIETGDNAAFDAVMPTLRQDLAAMSERTGDSGFAEAWGRTSDAPTAPAPQASQQVTAPRQQAPVIPGEGDLQALSIATRAVKHEGAGYTPTGYQPHRVTERTGYSGRSGYQAESLPAFGHTDRTEGGRLASGDTQ